MYRIFRKDNAMARVMVAVLLTAWAGAVWAQMRPIEPGARAGQGARARLVRVAAAADLKFALDEISEAFHRRHPDIRLQVSYGSSGNFFAQLSNRAPFDIFFSADVDYPRKLIEQRLAAQDTVFSYAVGRLVIWVPRTSRIALERLGMQAL